MFTGMTIARNAIIYARRSQLQQSGASVTDQVAAGKQACDELGWHEVAVIDADHDRSASRFAVKARPGWEQALTMLRGGHADALIVWETSRGSRKLSGWSAFLDLARDLGIVIHVIRDSRTYDPRIGVDWKTLADEGVGAAYDSEKMSASIRRGVRGAALRGMPYAAVPTGYKRVFDEETGRRIGWKADPEYGPVVREIIARVAKHEAVQAIARDLTGRGIPSPRSGGAWDQQSIRQIAINVAYTGYLIAPGGERVRGQWEPLVDESTWNAAQAVMANRTGPRPGKSVHLLSNLATCRECGADATTWNDHGRPLYKCKGKGCFYISEEWLDEFVAEVICARLARPDARDLFKPDDERSAFLRNSITALRTQLDEWAAAEISAHAYGIKEAKLLPQIERAERELGALTIPPALTDVLAAADVRQAWDGYGIPARRAIVMTLTGVQVGRWDHATPRVGEHRVSFTWEPVRRPGRGQRRTM
jgi:site-specific DNA recombinase